MNPSSPWRYEDVDADGKSPLDTLYATERERILKAFQEPLPPLPIDGTVPDVLVGFGQYRYQLRDQYKFAIASAVGLILPQVHLSTAWKLGFGPEGMGSMHKVLGVSLACTESDRDAQVRACRAFTQTDAQTTGFKILCDQEKHVLCQTLVHTINSRKNQSLLELNMQRASIPAPVVASPPTDAEIAAFSVRLRETLSSAPVVILHTREDTHLQAEEWNPVFFRCLAIPKYVVVEEYCTTEKERVTMEKCLDHLTAKNWAYPCIFLHGVHFGTSKQLKQMEKDVRRLKAIIQRPHDVQFSEKR